MHEDLTLKTRELLIWLNDNLPTPGRVRFMRGRGKAIALIFADSTSTSIEEATKNRAPDNPNEFPISIVFQILSAAGLLCERNFHNTANLKKIRDVLIAISAEMNQPEE